MMRNKWTINLKSLVALLLCIAMVLPLSGCKKKNASEKMLDMAVADAEDAIVQLADIQTEFGYENALSELTEQSTITIDGDNYYRLQQNYQGIPIYGRTVVCVTDAKGNISSLTGNVADITSDIKLTPTIDTTQAETSICAFYTDEYGYEPDEIKIDSLLAKDLYIFIENDTAEVHLAYCVYFDAYEFIIDAHNGQILSACLTLNEDSAETAEGCIESDRSQKFPVEKYGEYNYIMYDSSRKLRVYTLDYQPSGNGTKIAHNLATLVESDDVIFGNTKEEKRLEQEKGAALYQKAIFIHDYFDKLNFTPKVDGVYLYYNDGFCEGKNALGGVLEINKNLTGVVAMGSEKNAIDVVAHEYTHYVSRNVVNWMDGDETGAINEAVSDLFGELLESEDNSANRQEKVDPDWVHGDRNMIDPSENSYPEKASDRNKSGQDFSHGYSTVITHAAYLMWNGIDGTEAKKISTDDLAKLWYRAMLMMPSDCDFFTCRKVVELAATSMRLTTKQIKCVSQAFDEVGITAEIADSEPATYNISTDGTLCVYGGDKKPYDNYTLVIEEKKPFGDLRNSGMKRTISVDSAEAYKIELNEGQYVLTITDNINQNATKTFTVKVSKGEKNKKIEIYTIFGCMPVKGTVSEIKVQNGDEINIPIRNAVISVYYEDQKTPVEIIRMVSEKDGFFKRNLPPGIYSFVTEAEGYVPSTTTFELTDEKDAYVEIVLDAIQVKRLTEVIRTVSDGSYEKYSFSYDKSGQLVNYSSK